MAANNYRGLVSIVLIDARTGWARTVSLADRKSLSYVDATSALIQGGVGDVERKGR